MPEMAHFRIIAQLNHIVMLEAAIHQLALHEVMVLCPKLRDCKRIS